MADEPIGMDHPLFMARMQAGIDGQFLAMAEVGLPEAIARTIPRIRELFGEGIPRELVEVAVTVGYCSNSDSHSRKPDN
jgi:hypothetical protein